MVSGALLYGTGPDGPLPKSPSTPINDGAQLNVSYQNASDPVARGTFGNSLNFRLPTEWLTGVITLKLGWPGGLEPKNVVPSDCSVQAAFVPAPVPRINFYPINWTSNSGTAYQVDPNILNNLYLRVLACFPVPSITSVVRPPLVVPATGRQPTDEEIEDALDNLRNTEYLFPYKIYHGVLPVDPSVYQKYTGDTPRIPGPISYSMMLGSLVYGTTRQTVSHEIGHNLGLYHDVSLALFGKYVEIDNPNAPFDALGATNELGPLDYVYPLFQPFDGYPHGAPTLGPMTAGVNSLIYGLDTLTLKDTASAREPVVPPTNSDSADLNYYFDLMSYCRPPGFANEDAWPSSATYLNLMQQINTYFGSGTIVLPGYVAAPANGAIKPQFHPPHNPRPQGGGSDNYLVVRGSVNFDSGTAQLFPCQLLTSTNTPPAEAAGTNFVVEALDSIGNVLETSDFTLEPNSYAENITSNITGFTVFLTPNASIHKLVLLNNGVLLATLTAGSTDPAVTLTAPNGGQTFNGDPVNIAWSASDADGDPLTYTVQYSADDGLTWETLGANLFEQSLEVSSALLEASPEGLIRVTASDGVNIVTAQSATTFTIQPHPPSVTINAPADGSVFIGDQQLFLDSSVNDMQDGSLSGTNVQWSSDLVGPVGTGAIVNFDAKNLSEGYHTITVTATDNEGLTNSAETHVLILHFPPPQLNLVVNPGMTSFGTYYPPYGTLSWPSYYTNYALQSSANLTSGWTNVPASSVGQTGIQQQLYVIFSQAATFYRLALQL